MSKSFSYPNKGTCSKETHIVLNLSLIHISEPTRH